MKTTINIPDEKISALLVATGKGTKTEAVNEAVSEYLHRRRVSQLLSLAGKCDDFMSPEAFRKMRDDAEA